MYLHKQVEKEMKGIYWRTLAFKKKCDLPNKSKLHIGQLHAV